MPTSRPHLRDACRSLPIAAGSPTALERSERSRSAIGRYLYVIADDELHLGVFPQRGTAPGTLVRLRSRPPAVAQKGPQAAQAGPRGDRRVAAVRAAFPCGALFVLGSGSRPSRRKGVLVALDAKGAIAGRPRAVDLTPLYRAIGARVRCIEHRGCVRRRRAPGIAATRQQERRPQRAHPDRIDAAAGGHSVPERPCRVRRSSISRRSTWVRSQACRCASPTPQRRPGAALHSQRLPRTPKNSYADGACAGSAIGVVDYDDIAWPRCGDSKPALKVEGIAGATGCGTG